MWELLPLRREVSLPTAGYTTRRLEWSKISELSLVHVFLFRAGQTILPVSLLPPPGTITIEKSSAVGTVVGVRVLSFLCYGIPSPFVHPPQVLIVMCLLGAGLGYFAYSNRRMRTRFV